MKEIRKKDAKTGVTYLREGVTVALFLPSPLHEIVIDVGAAFEAYLESIPTDVLRWESIGSGSEEWRPVTKKTIAKCRAQLRTEAARNRRLTAFELADGDVAGDAPGYGILIIGGPSRPNFPDEMSLMQVFYPSDVLQPAQVQRFLDHFKTIAALLPYTSGYVSPALQWAELGAANAIRQSRAIMTRHAGYDVQENETGRKRLGSRLRGARWLNFLGPEIAKKLGGIKALKQALGKEITIDKVGHGVMIQAGDVPEIGDRARKVGTPLLRSVAKVLEPVTAFNEIVLLGAFNQDEEFLKKWEHRFLD